MKVDLVSGKVIDSNRRSAAGYDFLIDYICALIHSCMRRPQNSANERYKYNTSSDDGPV